MLRQNIIPFWKELFVAFKMAPNIKKHSLYFRVTDAYIKDIRVYENTDKRHFELSTGDVIMNIAVSFTLRFA